jgi:hypothetical protein
MGAQVARVCCASTNEAHMCRWCLVQIRTSRNRGHNQQQYNSGLTRVATMYHVADCGNTHTHKGMADLPSPASLDTKLMCLMMSQLQCFHFIFKKMALAAILRRTEHFYATRRSSPLAFRILSHGLDQMP